jgi:hypothetical protein
MPAESGALGGEGIRLDFEDGQGAVSEFVSRRENARA